MDGRRAVGRTAVGIVHAELGEQYGAIFWRITRFGIEQPIEPGLADFRERRQRDWTHRADSASGIPSIVRNLAAENVPGFLGQCNVTGGAIVLAGDEAVERVLHESFNGGFYTIARRFI